MININFYYFITSDDRCYCYYNKTKKIISIIYSPDNKSKTFNLLKKSGMNIKNKILVYLDLMLLLITFNKKKKISFSLILIILTLTI